MNELERYIREQYGQDLQELEELRQLAAEALPTVVDSWSRTKKAWPYKAFDKGKGYSFSTNSMILFMLSVVLEQTKTSSLIPPLPQNSGFTKMLFSRLKRDFGKDYQQTVKTRFCQGLAKLVERVELVEDKKKRKPKYASSKLLTISKTYGNNDVLTLTWLTELLRVAHSSDLSDYDDNAAATIKKHLTLREPLGNAIQELQKGTIEDVSNESPASLRQQLRCLFYREQLIYEQLDDSAEPLEHPFPLVRLVQLLEAHHHLKAEVVEDRAADRLNEKQLGGRALREYFEHGLHEHIAFHSIPDSRFDPAFLVFCLEGALRFPTSNVSMETIERALGVLEECQKEAPYWRSLTPILTTPRGNVLFPVSVEVANSLLRITELLDRRYEEPWCFPRCRRLLQRYVRWLRAQRVSQPFRASDVGNGKERLYYGWHSENVADPEQIHLWLTSEVVVFLLNYQLRFHEGMAHTMLKASGLQVKRDTTRDCPPGMSPSMYWSDGASEGEAKGWLKNEPLMRHPAEGSPYLIYDIILKKYLEPRDPGGQDKKSPDYSILLYGPPGTGKTTMCEEIAKALGWAFVIVTPSDFLSGGAAEVEARAKAIFTALQEQRDKVVLLDEIDHFLLDRESVEYERQTGIFQFMTPGMLTKINDLRAAEKILFVIATNYEERIDPAIKRPGRIDNKLLLLPPNLAQRNRILQGLFEQKEAQNTGNSRHQNTRPRGATLKKALAKVARKTALLTYTELEALVNKVEEEDSADNNRFSEALENARQSIKPAITLRGYNQRFYEHRVGGTPGDARKEKSPEKAPSVEYLLLLYIWLEAFFGTCEGKTLPEIEMQPDKQDVCGIEAILNVLGVKLTSPQLEMQEVFAKHVRDDDYVVDRLAEWLLKLREATED